MLELIITDSISPLTTVEIANVGGGADADYAVCVYDAQEDLIASAMLTGYRRWSAPTHDLVARAICTAFADEESIVPAALPYLDVPDVLVATLYLSPQRAPRLRLGRWTVYCLPDRFECGVEDESDAPPLFHCDIGANRDAGVWPLLLTTWCLSLGPDARLGPRRPPVQVPLHEHNGQPYVRTRDFPEHIKGPFRKRFFLSACPLIPGADDAYYPWDLEVFLGYAPWPQQGGTTP